MEGDGIGGWLARYRLRMVGLTVYLTPEQMQALRALAEATGRPMAHYVREAVDEVLGLYDAGGGAGDAPTESW